MRAGLIVARVLEFLRENGYDELTYVDSIKVENGALVSELGYRGNNGVFAGYRYGTVLKKDKETGENVPTYARRTSSDPLLRSWRNTSMVAEQQALTPKRIARVLRTSKAVSMTGFASMMRSISWWISTTPLLTHSSPSNNLIRRWALRVSVAVGLHLAIKTVKFAACQKMAAASWALVPA